MGVVGLEGLGGSWAPGVVPDCQDCGACCFAATPGHVRLSGEDHARLTPAEAERTVFRGTRCFFQVTPGGRCVNLAVEGGRFACSLYERRPQVCRDYERGGEACAYDRERVYGARALPLAPPPTE